MMVLRPGKHSKKSSAGLSLARRWRSPPAWPPLPRCLISLRLAPLWCCRTIAIRVLQAWPQRALNEDEGFRAAAASHHATIQQVITRDEGKAHYWIEIADGKIAMGIGEYE